MFYSRSFYNTLLPVFSDCTFLRLDFIPIVPPSSDAKDKQATQRGAEQTSNAYQRDAGWASCVVSHFFIVRPILVLMNLGWRLNICLCVKPFITWIGQTIKKMASDERRPIPRLADVSCLFLPRLSELFVCSAPRWVACLSLAPDALWSPSRAEQGAQDFS